MMTSDRQGPSLFPKIRAQIEAEEAEAEAANAELVRQGEISGLLRELADYERRREEVLSESPSERLIVVDADGNDTGMRVRRESVKDRRTERERSIRQLEDTLELIDGELRARGHAA